jgi:hypothetical protein
LSHQPREQRRMGKLKPKVSVLTTTVPSSEITCTRRTFYISNHDV